MDRPLHILIVDDRTDSVFLLSEFLLKRHHRVEVSSDSRESLNAVGRRRVKGDPYDLVIASARMPGIDGIGILRELRERNDPTMIALIDPDGDIDAVATRAAEALGCATFLDKPIDLGRVESLLAVVRSAVGLGAAPAHGHGTPTPAPTTDAHILHGSDQFTVRPVPAAAEGPAPLPMPVTVSAPPIAPVAPLSSLSLQPAAPAPTAPLTLQPAALLAPDSSFALQPAAPAPPAPPPLALPPQPPPAPTTQIRMKPKDEPFFGTARVVRAVGGNLDRGGAAPVQPGSGRLGNNQQPGTARTPTPSGANPFTDSYPSSPSAGPPPIADPFAGRSDTARLRRAVTGRVERPGTAQGVDEGIRSSALERRVVCAVCRKEFLVANRLQEFTVVCVHCGQLNRIAPRAAR